MDGKRPVFVFTTLLITLLIIYWNAFDGQWQYDDFVNIVDNPNVHVTTLNGDAIARVFTGKNGPPTQDSRPLAYLTFALNHHLGGLNVFGYHLVNLTIHILTAFILFLFIHATLKLPSLSNFDAENAYVIALLSTFLWASSMGFDRIPFSSRICSMMKEVGFPIACSILLSGMSRSNDRKTI